MQKSNWKKYTLGQVSIDVSYGYTASANSIPIGPKFLRITDIIPYFINWNNVLYCTINNNLISKYKLKRGDVVIARTGATTGYNAVIDADINSVFASFLIRFRLNQNIVFSKFIKYILKSDFYKDFIANHIGGSAQPGINAKTLSLFPINLPPIEEQKRIADILGAFDDKIELLQKQNITLENMAKALFKSWFVDFDVVHAKQQGQPKAAVMQQYHLTEELYNLFPSSFEPSALGPIPTGWQVKTLGQVSLCFDSKRVPLSNRDRASRRGVYPYFGATSVMDYINDFLFDDIYLLLGEDGSVIKNDGTPFLQYVFGKIWVNNHAHVLQGQEPITTEFLYLFLSDFQIQPYVTGAVQAKLNQKNMNSIPMVIPDKNILNYFNIYAKRLFNKIIHNHKQIQTLTEMRDALLPRLISGKIRV